ncbi:MULTISPECIES: hypothetical protein [Pseudomonas]|uniref:Uncharacterized protein n=1 Tax=Pseudomonas quercus TaxID=2722792 RepID=A0ABX0YJK5_9PSED|nr:MULTISPECIES: hypothetical protein [Pseudomonas]MBF7143760.1 hypothetical protein [Pseudomonas sp. LY10J]NJP02362.1 hypothetical protein [Pseudomonas quercus]
MAPFIILIIFAYGFVLGMTGDFDLGLARQMLLGVLSLFLIYIIVHYQINMENVLKISGVSLALIMCGFSFMLMVFPGFFIGDMLLDYYNAHELGFYGVRNFGGLQLFMLHHRSSPFLLVPLSLLFLDFLRYRKIITLLCIGVIIAAIICTASRALMAMAVISLFVLYLHHKTWPQRILILSVVIPIFVIGVVYLLNQTSVLSSSEQSNSIKLGHIASFFDTVDWSMLFFGRGLGSYFYTEGYGAVVSQTEITWLDSVRFVGFPLSLVLMGSILFPVRRIMGLKENIPQFIIIVLYLIMSLSNPVLFNSFGFLVILWYWSVVMSNQPKERFALQSRKLL